MNTPRRVVALAAAVAGTIMFMPATALAHGFGGRIDLPIPRSMFLWGAIAALVISFVALGALWTTSRFQDDPMGPLVPPTRLWSSRAAAYIVRGLSLAFFLIVLMGAIAGDTDPLLNLAPVVIWVWLWVGLAIAHAAFGNLWKTLSPFDTLARMLGIGATAGRALPRAMGMWPAAVSLLGFVWLELAVPFRTDPHFLGGLIVAYTLVTLSAMALFGREEWNARGEVFAVYLGMLARIAPFGRDGDGRLHLRWPLSALPSMPPMPGTISLIVILLGSTTFDGLTRGGWWMGLTRSMQAGSLFALSTLGLAVTIGLVTGAYTGAMWLAGRVTDEAWHPVAVRYAHTLVPIAFAYVVAHYFSLLLIEGQIGLIVASDPFNSGWNLFGTALWEYGQTFLTALSIWYIQLAVIVLGHVAGVVLAHDRAIANHDKSVAMRTQYALLAVMVAFTAVGLLILSG